MAQCSSRCNRPSPRQAWLSVPIMLRNKGLRAAQHDQRQGLLPALLTSPYGGRR